MMHLGDKTARRRLRTRLTNSTAVVLLAASLGAFGASAPAYAQNYTFNSVDIEGNARIEDGAILNYAGIARGQSVSAGQLNDAYQRLVASGLFETVEVVPAGNTLRIVVTEYPTINRINFEGNKRIKDDQLSEIVESASRRVFNPAQAERDAAKISEAYSQDGRLAARVTPRLIRLNDNRVNLVFEIVEGDVAEVERLSFVGNRAYSDRRLRRVLETKQAGIFRALIRRDTLVEDRIEFDKQVLTDFYYSRGYVDFRTNSVSANLARERDGYFIQFNVTEGQQFKFGQVTTVSEIPQADADLYQQVVKVRPGVVYSPTLVENEIARMERLAIKQGLDFLRVEPRVTRNDRDLTLDIEFVLKQGDRVFVERIDIEGNTTTLDQVVRRQFKVVEGDPFNPREIRQSAERIRALGYFSNAAVDAREGSSPDQVVIDVNVEEQPTGSLNFGGTFSSNDGFGLAVSFSETNFLGRGQTLSLNVSTASEARRYGIQFIEPNMLGRDLEFGLALDYTEGTSSYTSYDTTAFVFSPSLAFPVSENGRLSVNYTARQVEMEARDPIEHGAVIGNEIARGAEFASSIGYNYTYDTRRTGLDPNAGVLFRFGQEFAGLGGDNEYIKTTALITAQKAVFNEEVILRATLEGGALAWRGGNSRTVDRFLLTPKVIRGFDPGGIGPRDQSGTADDALGGNFFAAARFEAEFPLGLPEEYGIRGGVFYDIGNLWDLSDTDLTGGSIVGAGGSARHVIGLTVFWDTVLGPLRFNFSKALEKEVFDREQSFELTISTRF